MRIARWLADLALAALVVAACHGVASAEPLVDARIKKADRLFAEGKALLAKNLLQACAKFDASLRENPAAIGTLLNVALCDEKLGRVASAVAKFSEARDHAKEQGLPEHVRAAEEHITKLTPDVPHLAIKLTEQLPETRVVVDESMIAPGAIGDVAVDPGERVVVVSAPARLPYRTTVVIGAAEHREVVVPALARSVTINSSRGRIGQITTIVGGAALGTGIGIGLYARNLHHKQFDNGQCTTDPVKGDRCSPDGLTQTNRARTLGNVGTVIGVAGLVATGVGVYLWLRSPRSTPQDSSDKKLVVVPEVSADSLGVVASGRF